jgi:hypothetical protein
VCHCDDCQAFALFLGQEGVLDARGGTDIYQMPPADLRVAEGAQELRCVRLSEKGMFRWYTACCRTPVGNTVGPRMPFVGVVHRFMDHAADGRSRDQVLGPAASIQGRFAVGGLPAHAHSTAPIGLIVRTVILLLRWRIAGKQTPSPFFDAQTRRPRVEPEVLTPAERERLQALVTAGALPGSPTNTLESAS